MRRRRLRLRTALLALAAVYAAWLAAQAVGYKRYVSAPVEASSSPAPPFPVELLGAYHMHTKFSDGRKTVEAVAEVARRAGLDFIILTDHGSPNEPSLAAQGRKDGLLVLAGTEISSSRGHLVALAFEPPPRPFAQNAALAAREVRALGGFTIIAHPFSKTRWSWGGEDVYNGLEIMDSDSMLRRHWPRALIRLPLLFFKHEAVFLKIVARPEDQIRMWDRMLEEGMALGFFSVDAHWLYRPAFALFRLHVLLEESPAADFAAARTQIFEALRHGRFFSAVDAAADPAGFRFWLDGQTLRVRAPYSFAHEARLIHGGRAVAVSMESEFAHPAAGPGAYRVEVYLRERSPLDGDVPWIISNPVIVPAGGKESR